MEQRKFLTRRDLPFFAGLLALGGLCALLLSLAPAGATAVVEVEGQVVLTRQLSQLTGPEEISLTGAEGIRLTVTLSPQGAAITHSTCPDQTCVRTGWLTRAGESALCLPAKASLRLTGDGGVDAATY